MKLKTRFLRLLVGMIVVVVNVGLGFNLLVPLVNTLGATRAEIEAVYPGDELLKDPALVWTHAVTIDAPQETVWPWIAQIGDSRAAFYSYMFIENQAGQMMGAENYSVVYRNADHIVPEWQNPQPGEWLIEGTLEIVEVKTGEYLLGNTVLDMGWTWLWQIHPEGEDKTRLVIRSRMGHLDSAASDPVMNWVMNAGGSVMAINMLHGIVERAEGRGEPANIEIIEIILWFVALLAGLAAGLAFIFRPAWILPLVVGIAAVWVVMILTFLQPEIWLRGVLDAVLLAGVIASWRA